jgi:hypothetical protein
MEKSRQWLASMKTINSKSCVAVQSEVDHNFDVRTTDDGFRSALDLVAVITGKQTDGSDDGAVARRRKQAGKIITSSPIMNFTRMFSWNVPWVFTAVWERPNWSPSRMHSG